MAGSRSELIRSRVTLALPPGKEGDNLGVTGNIYYAMNRIINRICEEASALQAKQTVTIVVGTELYNFPDGFIAERAILGSSTTPIEKKSIAEVAEIKRIGTALDNTTTDPVYYYKWNNQIGFLNPAGGAPSGAGTVTIYGWRVPLSDGSEDASETVDPIVNQRWDYCIELGALSLLGLGDSIKYEYEFSRQRTNQGGASDVEYQIPVNRSYD